jgi:amino acid transporter
MATQLPTNESMENMVDLFGYINTASDGLFFFGMLISIFVILFIMLKSGYSNGKAFLGTSFIVMVLGILLTIIGWLDPMYMYMTILMTAIGAVWGYLDNAAE